MLFPEQEPKEELDAVTKNEGVTSAERYLKKLCERSFLSLWSYPCVYRDDRQTKKEIADMLVIFEDHIIVFSDKHCAFTESKDLEVGWKRWFKKAVHRSALQAWGAEKWIRSHPDKLFLDKKCTQSFPLELPDIKKAKFHLITVAHGVSEQCMKQFDGSGSLMLCSHIKGLENHDAPFMIGDLDLKKSFVHVLDDASLNIVMSTLDTISDFVAYFTKKEELFRSGVAVFVAGEEELLARYLRNINDKGEHDFNFPNDAKGIALAEGHWEDFKKNPQRKAQLEADKISYAWDSLIETFSEHALKGTQFHATPVGIKTSEKILRFLAREHRFKRRVLANNLKDLLEKTPKDLIGRRYVISQREGDPYYVFLLFPYQKAKTYAENRQARMHYLEACCRVVKYKYPNAKDIIGIATEAGIDNGGRSEDVAYFDARKWTENDQKDAEKLQKELGILQNPALKPANDKEYPDVN